MYKDSKTIIPYDDIDYELRDIIKCLNKFDGIETVSCCSGHNELPCAIYFKAESVEAITRLLFNVFDCDPLWHIECDTQDVHRDWTDLHFVLTSGVIKDYPTVNLMIDNLRYRLCEMVMRNE